MSSAMTTTICPLPSACGDLPVRSADLSFFSKRAHWRISPLIIFAAMTILFLCGVSAVLHPAFAQGEVLKEQDLTVIEEAPPAMMERPVVRIRILNKITAITRTYNIDVGKPVAFDSLRINPKACRKAPPIAEPESAAFLEVWEQHAHKNNMKPVWVFSGWMFASSPGLSAMDHPVYDVWVLDCLKKKSKAPAEASSDSNAASDSDTDAE